MASVEQAPVNRCKPVLPSLDAGVAAETMFDEVKAAARLEDAIYFGQGILDQGYAAEGPGADHAVETLIGKVKAGRVPRVEVHLDASGPDATACDGVHPGVRIDGRDAAYSRRIMRQVATGPESHLQHIPMHSGQYRRSKRCNRGHAEVHEARKKNVPVNSHRNLLAYVRANDGRSGVRSVYL
jgi:hypothetical protein